MKSTPFAIALAMSAALLLSACGNPEKSAQTAGDKALKAWQSEAGDLNPTQRLKRYDGIIKDVTSIGKDYPKTTYGRAIAAGRSVNGLSLTAMQKTRDELAPRAKCYANPTVDCLLPFSSHPGGTADNASTGSASAVAEQQVCTAGFAAADKSLDAIKINRQAYAQDLVQVALTAAKCNRPNDVKAAVEQYIKAVPAEGGAQTGALLSVLATAALKPAWPMAIASLESALKSGHMAANESASVVLSLALKYAQTGNAKAALAKYATFTDTLHYQADASSKNTLVTALILDGEADSALKIAGAVGDQDLTAIALQDAAVALGTRMGLTENNLGAAPSFGYIKDIQTYFTPVTGPTKARDEASAAALEAQIDKLAPGVTRSPQVVGGIGLDTDYGVVALAYQKLGEPAKADAAIKKAIALRTRLLGSVDGDDNYANFAAFPALVAIAQNHLTEAAQYVKTAHLFTDSYGRMLMRQTGRTQDAAHALAIANTISGQRDLDHCYSDLIPVMAKAGKTAQVQKLIDAWTGNPAGKSYFYDQVVDGMIAAGNADGARKYAESHHLADTPKGKLSLDSRLLTSKQIAGDKAKAEPLIREMFAIGQKIDKAGGISHGGGYAMTRYTDNKIAQNAAKAAFENGYIDLGIELYRKAANKDQRPLLAAFDSKISKSDMTRVLMLAQNNVQGQRLAYVIDTAIAHLQKSQGASA